MKSILDKIWDKLCIKQWSVGLAYATPEEVLQNGISNLDFKWLPIADQSRFLADPFIVRKDDGEILLYAEDFHFQEQYGKISVFRLNNQFEVMDSSVILDTGSHLSYPSVLSFEGKHYLIPESGLANELRAHELDPTGMTIIASTILHQGEALLDATMLTYQQQHWMFATQRGKGSNSDLNIYKASAWNGPYSSLKQNPVKSNLDGSRPAGHFFQINGAIYRPAQNSREYYGKSITIHKLERLTESEFKEIPVMTLLPPQNSTYNYAIHTINFSNGVIVIDGLRKIFNPWKQLTFLLLKRRRMRQQ